MRGSSSKWIVLQLGHPQTRKINFEKQVSDTLTTPRTKYYHSVTGDFPKQNNLCSLF